jgi:CHAP domain
VGGTVEVDMSSARPIKGFLVSAVTFVAATFGVSGPVSASPVMPRHGVLAGCAFKDLCVIDGGRIVYSALGNSTAWPVQANERADRIVNNGSAYDVVIFEHASSDKRHADGWALCVPQGRVVDLGALQPAVINQASSHRWVPANHCGGKITWMASAKPTAKLVADVAGGALRFARAELGVREVAVNKGRRVTEYQKSVRNDDYALGQAWCASFITWTFLQAGDRTPLRSALVSEWVAEARRNRFGLSLVRSADVRAGDLVTLMKAGKWEHMGIVSSVAANGKVQVISGNTTVPFGRAEGVFEKPLTTWTGAGFTATFLRKGA